MVSMLLWATVASAVQVRLAAEPATLQEGQTGTVRLIIVAGARGEPQFETRRAPSLPVGAGLREQFVGQSRQFQNINGRISQILEFDYRVTALDAGNWEIGPVELELDDGSKAIAKSVTLAVGERVVIEGVVPDYEVEASFITKGDKVYEGEVVLLHARYRSRFVGSQVSWSLPTFDGLHQAQHGQPQDSSYTIDDPSGTILVQDLYVPLVAVATGARDQGVVMASIQIPVGGSDLLGFRRTRHEQLVSDHLDLDVRPLPPAPPGFSGLIGEFEVRSEITSDKAAVGQSIPWSVAVIGNGSLDGFVLPALTAEGASLYDNGSEVTARVDGDSYHATAAFRRVIVPTVPGQLTLPELPLITFSPERGQYVTLLIPTGQIMVVEGKEGTAQVESYGTTQQPDSNPVTIDVRSIYSNGRATVPRSMPILFPMLALAALPGLMLFGLAGLSTIRLEIGAVRERRRQARLGPPTAGAVLRALPEDPNDRLVVLDVALRRIEGRNVDAERLRALRMRLGRVRFGDGTPDLSLEDDIRALVSEVEG